MTTPFNPSDTVFASSPTKKTRGFASLDRETRRDVASAGGRAAHACGRAHQFTSEQARAAALKSHASRKAKKEQDK